MDELERYIKRPKSRQLRMQIQLSEQDSKSLRRLAANHNTTILEMVRALIRQATNEHKENNQKGQPYG
jgi:hypothetical protein